MREFYFLFIVINVFSYIFVRNQHRPLEYVNLLFIAFFVAITRHIPGSYIATDQERYIYSYENINLYKNFAPGFKALNLLGRYFGISFYTFYTIVVVVSTVLVYYGVKRLTNETRVLTLIFLLYYNLIAIDLLKNYIAFAIFINAFYYIANTEAYCRWKYLLGVLLSATIHVSFIIFIIFLLSDVNISLVRKKIKRRRYMFSVISIMLLIVLTKSQYLVSSVLGFGIKMIIRNPVLAERYIKYAYKTTHWSAMVPILLISVTLLGMKVVSDNLNYTGHLDMNRVERICFFVIVILPIVFLSTEFFRIVRDITVIMCTIMAGKGYSGSIKTRCKSLAVTFSVFSGWFLFDIVIKGHFDQFLTDYFASQVYVWK